MIKGTLQRIMLYLLLILMATSAMAEMKPLEVSGEALVLDNNLPQARSRALEEAFSEAITKILGTFITAESFTRNYESIERSVLGKNRGYIKTYDVLNEQVKDEILTLNVMVTVTTEEVKNDLTALEILLDRLGNPRIILQGRDDGLDESVSIKVFKDKLLQHGFQLLDDDSNGDVIVRLSGTVQNMNPIGNLKLNGGIVSLEARASWSDSNRLIADVQKDVNGAGVNRIAALKDGYTKAAEAILPEFLDKLTTVWQDEANNGRPITVYLHDTNFSQARTFNRRLAGIFGVKTAKLNSLQDGKAVIQTRFCGTASLLAELVDRTRFTTGTGTPVVVTVDSESIHLRLATK